MTKISTAIGVVRRKWDMGFHQHPEYEIAAVLEGSGMFQFEEQVFSIEAGHIVVIPPNIAHRYWTEASIRFAVIIASDIPTECKELFDKLTISSSPGIFHLSLFDLELYESMFRNWIKVVSQLPHEETAIVSTWFKLFILFLLQHVRKGSNSLSVVHAADYIRLNIHKEITIIDLAKQARLSPAAFRKSFRVTYGISPKQYQQQCRLTQSKYLLRSSNITIEAVAGKIGFAALHSFSAWFHKHQGISPSEWRKQEQGI